MRTIGFKTNWLGIQVRDGWRHLTVSRKYTHNLCGYPLSIGKTDEDELFGYCDKCEMLWEITDN